jgi:hypothetical protein
VLEGRSSEMLRDPGLISSYLGETRPAAVRRPRRSLRALDGARS